MIRQDDGKAKLATHNLNKHLSALQSECKENDNFSSQHLRRKGLHLNLKGNGDLLHIFCYKFEKFQVQPDT